MNKTRSTWKQVGEAGAGLCHHHHHPPPHVEILSREKTQNLELLTKEGMVWPPHQATQLLRPASGKQAPRQFSPRGAFKPSGAPIFPTAALDHLTRGQWGLHSWVPQEQSQSQFLACCHSPFNLSSSFGLRDRLLVWHWWGPREVY